MRNFEAEVTGRLIKAGCVLAGHTEKLLIWYLRITPEIPLLYPCNQKPSYLSANILNPQIEK